MSQRYTYKPGMRVIYRRERYSKHPSPKAQDVRPATAGEGYYYAVSKFWIVDTVLSNGTIVARSRKGKLHQLSPADPNLRPARFWERLKLAGQFPPPHADPSTWPVPAGEVKSSKRPTYQ